MNRSEITSAMMGLSRSRLVMLTMTTLALSYFVREDMHFLPCQILPFSVPVENTFRGMSFGSLPNCIGRPNNQPE